MEEKIRTKRCQENFALKWFFLRDQMVKFNEDGYDKRIFERGMEEEDLYD